MDDAEASELDGRWTRLASFITNRKVQAAALTLLLITTTLPVRAQTLTLTNTGKGPLTVENASLTGADAASFSIASDTGEATLSPGASRTIQVCFTPAAAAACTAATITFGARLRWCGSTAGCRPFLWRWQFDCNKILFHSRIDLAINN